MWTQTIKQTTMALKKLTVFGVFHNRIVGEKIKAKDINDLMENRMSKRNKEFWSEIKFKDDEENTIVVSRTHLDEGMTIDEIIEDWKQWNPEMLQDEIHTI